MRGCYGVWEALLYPMSTVFLGGGMGVLGMFATLQRSTNHRFAKTNKSPPETFLSSAVVGMGPLDGRCLF